MLNVWQDQNMYKYLQGLCVEYAYASYVAICLTRVKDGYNMDILYGYPVILPGGTACCPKQKLSLLH